LPGDLMHGIQVDQDISCRIVGRCTYGGFLDRELMDLVPRRPSAVTGEPSGGSTIPLSTNLGRQFLYARYNADLSDAGLRDLGFTDIVPERIQRIDAVENIADLLRVGRAAANRVSAAHFGPFLA
jgi:hypothetical protein